MRFRELTPARSHVLVLESGEEVLSALTRHAERASVASASFTGVGVFRSARIGYLDDATGRYEEHDLDEPSEVLAFGGSIVRDADGPSVHAHVALGTRDTSVRGGHLLVGVVHPTLEVFLDVYDEVLERRPDAATGQELIAP